MNNYYDGDTNNDIGLSATIYENQCAQAYKSEWKEYLSKTGGTLGKDEDPDISQRDELMGFIKERFGTTSDNWVSASGANNSTWNSMVDDSRNANIEQGCGSECGGRALMLLNAGSGKYHAVVIEGKSKTDENGKTYWDSYDPSDNNPSGYSKIYRSQIIYGVGISKKKVGDDEIPVE